MNPPTLRDVIDQLNAQVVDDFCGRGRTVVIDKAELLAALAAAPPPDDLKPNADFKQVKDWVQPKYLHPTCASHGCQERRREER